MEHALFNSVPTTPCSTPQTLPRLVCRCLSFISVDNYTPDNTPGDEEEEDFQTVPLDDEHWTSEKTSERIYAFMNMGYLMDYASTHVLM